MFRVNLFADFLFVLLLNGVAFAQVPDSGYWKYMRAITPEGYVCYRTSGAVEIDGRLDDAAWKAAP